MYHEQPPGVAKAMEAKGLRYCPWREAWVEPPTTTATPAPRSSPNAASCVAAQSTDPDLLMPSLPKPWLNLKIIKPDSPPPRDYQERFLTRFYATQDQSFLLQAPTGSGKTFTALYAAAQQLEQERRVVFVVPTDDLLEQTYDEATRLFGSRPEMIRKLSGQNKKAREAAYQDPAAKLLIIEGPSCWIDIKRGYLDPVSHGLFILDEGDLRRGLEPLAQIITKFKGMTKPPRIILMSATLTIADEGSSHYLAEVQELKRQTGIPNFIQLHPDANQQSRYDITREKVRLQSDAYTAATALQKDFHDRLDHIEGALPSLPFCSARDTLGRQISSMRKALTETNPLRLPSIKSALTLPKLLSSMIKFADSAGQEFDIKTLTRIGYEMQFLHHAHQLLVTASRVSFLEYTSEMLFRCRCPGVAGKTAASPSEQSIFRPGLPPAWWSVLAAGTPYELISKVTRSSAAPVERFLKEHGSSARGHVEVAKQFFWNGKELGAAAKSLIMAPPGAEHPKLDSLLAWIRGPLRKKDRGQVLVNCWTALDAKFLAARLAALTRETTVALVGQSHTTRDARLRNFALAKSGEASIVCGTSVVGRGVDLPKLRYLVMLDPTSDLRVAKQFFGRVGRGEDMFGSVVILITEDGPDEMRNIARQQKAISAGVTFPERAPVGPKGKRLPTRTEPDLWSIGE